MLDLRGSVASGPLEEIAEPDIGELCLSLGWVRDEHPNRTRARLCDPRLPEGRLPDPGLARDDERPSPVVGRGEELLDRAELRVPSDNGLHHTDAF